jgi:glycosyltransferase involved in cell wall biosynthesis
VSPDLARDLEPLTRARISVVANPVADDLLRAPGCNAASFEGKKVVMVLNGWGALKNGATALRAFALARREDPQLHLACMGSDFEGGGPAHRWALAERLTDGVEFCGPVPQSTLRARLQAGAALLHPSRLESFGMSVAEAMALGLPPIAGRLTPALSWLLDGGRVGVLVDVNDPHAIARELIALTRDQGRWQAISTGARARARELFAASAVAARFESLYAALLQSEPEARPAGRLDKVFSRAPS